MSSILKIRDRITVLFRNYETIIKFALKFLAGLIMIGSINTVGYYREGFEGFAGGFLWTLGLSALYAIAPPTAAFLVLLATAMIQISASLELMLMVFLIGVCVITFYCRLEPQKSLVIIAMIIGYYFRIPYLVVLLAGLYIGFAAIIPVTLGTAVWHLLPMFQGLVHRGATPETTGFDVSAVTDSITDIYTTVHAQFTGDLQWIFSAFIYVMVIILVYAVSRLTINYSKEISLALGGVLCIFGIAISSSISESGDGIIAPILFALLSIALAEVFRFFDVALDYKKVEYVEFEDEDNYYYVKIVNKLGSGEKAPVKPRVSDYMERVPERDLRRRAASEPPSEPKPRRVRSAGSRGTTPPPVRPAGRTTARRPPPPEPDWDDDY